MHREVKQTFPSHTARPGTQAGCMQPLLLVHDFHPLTCTMANIAYLWAIQLIELKELFLFHVSFLFLFFCFCFLILLSEKKFFNVLFCFWERERDRERERDSMSGGRAERERIWSRLQALRHQHRAGHGAWTHKPCDHDLSWSQMLNWLSQPGAP